MRGHMMGSVLMFPVYYAVYKGVGLLMGDTYRPSSGILMLAYILFFLGGDLPDIDSPQAPIRWFTWGLIPAALIMSLWDLEKAEKLFEPLEQWGDVLYLAVIVLAGLLAGNALKLLKHRGFLHTSTFAALYAGVVFSWLRWGMNLYGNDLLFPTLAAFFGVYTHLLLDYRDPLVIFRIFSKRQS